MQVIKKSFFEYKFLLATIITMALPAIIEMAMNTLLGVADTLMISHLVGTEALSAVGFANQIIFTLIFIFSSFNTGATALISRSYGEQDYKKLNSVAGQTISINLIIGLVITILSFIFTKQTFSIFDISDEVRKMTFKYYYIVLIGMLPMFFSFSCAAILRGAGNTIAPMIITAFSNIINIFGNYVLITGVGPFPQMGIAGAALSTSIARIFTMVIYVYYLYIKRERIRITLNNMKLSKNILKPLWEISYPGAIEQALMQISFVVIGVIVSQLDTISEASFRILIQIESISYMPGVGLSIAAAALIGKYLGEKDKGKAVQTGYASFALSIAWGIFIGIIFILFSKYILEAFSPDQKVVLLAVPVMFFLALNQPFLNLIIVQGGALRGAGDTKVVMVITAFRVWLVYVPVAYIFTLKLNQGIKGIWQAEMIAFIIFCTVMFIRFYRKKWTRIKINIQR